MALAPGFSGVNDVGGRYFAEAGAYHGKRGTKAYFDGMGIEKDQRKENAVTHKIDPDIDGERDFIAATLQQVGMVEATGYMDRPKQIKNTKTATGGEIKTDGRTLVIVLK